MFISVVFFGSNGLGNTNIKFSFLIIYKIFEFTIDTFVIVPDYFFFNYHKIIIKNADEEHIFVINKSGKIGGKSAR